MRMFLIFHGRFPSEKAASLFAAKSAEAFADAGLDVTLLAPRRKGRTGADPYSYYGTKKNYEIAYLPTLDLFGMPVLERLAFYASFAAFSISVFFHILRRSKRGDVAYSNETLPLLGSTLAGAPGIYEMHDFPESGFWYYRLLFRRVRGAIVHNRWKLERVMRELGAPAEKLLFEPNAVDLGEFDMPIAKDEAREKLGLPKDRRIAVYTGHLYGWKGADTLAAAAEKLPDDVMTYFVGGTAHDVADFSARFGSGRAVFVGHRNHSEIPLWQKAADVLVIPNTAKERISRYYTSPMKLFEYMASGRPIVASRIESIEEIVGEEDVFFSAPDDPHDLGIAIMLALDDNVSSEKVKNCMKKVKEHTWLLRARRITKFITDAKVDN